MSAAHALQRQFKVERVEVEGVGNGREELSKHPIPGFRVTLKDDNIFEWEVGIIGPLRTPYEGGYFLATIKFPPDFPFNPPTFTFNNEFFHPNVYPDGRLCISILHPPGDDPMSGEKAEERWNPTQSVESILLSVVSLLNDPNCSSPANVDAGVLYRKDRAEYTRRVREQAEKSKKDIPPDLKMPTTDEDFIMKPPEVVEVDDNFWMEEDEDEDEDEDEEDGDDYDEDEEEEEEEDEDEE